MTIFFWIMLLSAALLGADSFESWVKEGKVSGNIRYYYIETNKKSITGLHSSAYGHSIGGQLHYSTGRWNGWKLGTTLMSVQPFALPEHVESSSIGQDNGVRGDDPSDGFTIIAEGYGDYANDRFSGWYGRRAINTPMIGAKDVRMLPSTVEGGEGTVRLSDSTSISVGYVERFKQRSSDRFSNILKHALGADTFSITGREEGYAIPVMLTYASSPLTLRLYNLYLPDFLNTAYTDIEYKGDFYTLSAEAVSQKSVGNADINLAKATSVTQGKKIDASGIGVRAEFSYKESGWDLVYRSIFRDDSAYDSILTPWDGTLMYAYSSTTNSLGQSFYGNALSAGGGCVGGTQGYKIGYTQKYQFLEWEGISTHLAYALYTNPRYREDQQDIKAILRYKKGNWSWELKGIWIDNDTTSTKEGRVNQVDWLNQYHVIVNYVF